jgi:hypothetical protein
VVRGATNSLEGCCSISFVITGRQRPASNASGPTLPDPVIHVDYQRKRYFIMDGRVEPGHDDV